MTVRQRSWPSELRDVRRLASVRHLVSHERYRCIVDVGTGEGNVALAFAAVADEVVGVDPDRSGLLTLMHRVQEPERAFETAFGLSYPVHNVTTLAGVAEDLSAFVTGSVDLVTCRSAFHLFGDRKAALEEIRRILRPLGTFILAEPLVPETVRDAWSDLLSRRDGVRHQYAAYHDHDRLLRSAGFEAEVIAPWDLGHIISRYENPLFFDYAQRAIGDFNDADRSSLGISLERDSVAYRYSCLAWRSRVLGRIA